MRPDLSPYLAFEGEAREALEFYARALGGEPLVEAYGQHGASQDPADHDRVLYGVLRTPDGFVIRVTDTPTAASLTRGDAYSVCLNGDDDDLLRGCWARLAAGARVDQELAVSAWGDAYGRLTDRFGVVWQVNIGASE
ncbi:MAG TPA: VOC family protein [Actinotalea sp.]|nr:VOC family protein [Actinotalea sp.]